jgi:glycosyltransferase involved in cell wall biosynthesis
VKLAVLQNLVSPTRHALFEALAERADLTVLFMARTEPTRGWDSAAELRYPHEFLPGVHASLRVGGDVDAVHLNPTVVSAIRRGRYDALLCAGYLSPTSWLALGAAKSARTRFLLWFGTPWPPAGARGRIAAPLKQLIVRSSDVVVAYGEAARAQALALGAAPDRVHIAVNTTDVRPFAAAQHVPSTRPTALWVSRFMPRKRADLAVSLLARLAGEVPGLRAVFVGDGPERAATEVAAQRADLDATFMGDVAYDELPALYAAADLFVLRSEREPWGLVVNEALAAGVPVLASTGVVAARELVPAAAGAVSDNEGVLVEAGVRLLGDPVARDAARAVLPQMLPTAWADAVASAAADAVR